MGNTQGQEAIQHNRPVRQNVDRRHQRYNPEQKERALNLVDENRLTYRQIAVQIDPHCSAGTICRWVKERNNNVELLRRAEVFRQNQEARDLGVHQHHVTGW